MHEQPNSISSHKMLLLASLVAVIVHALLFVFKLEFNKGPPIQKSEPLSVSLYFEKPEEPEPLIEKKQEKKQVQKESQEEVFSSPVNPIVKSDVIVSTPPPDKQETSVVSININTIKQWSKSDAKDFVDNLEQAPLSGLRKDSYEERLLDPSRIDQRTDDKSNKISTTDGVIHRFKIRGKTVCAMTVHNNDAFNDLDLTPLTGIAKSYECGDIQRKNALLNQDGTIKNSDDEDWAITSP